MIRPTASDLTDLTAEEFRRLEFLHTQYRTKVQTHRVLENPGILLPFRVQTNSLKVLELEFKVLDEII
jgi:hypothetical protein